MLFAYEITGDASNKCVFCDTQEEANTLQNEGYFISDVAINWKEKMYVDGKIVDRPIIPPDPVIPPTKEQLLQQLDWEYQPQFLEITRAWANANMDGNTELANSITADRLALKQEYEQKRGEING